MNTLSEKPIGVFDSGLGGLTVARELRNLLPSENILYFGDTAHVPYGDRSDEAIIQFTTENVNLLRKHGIKALVIACNTSDAIARNTLVDQYDIPILGVIEPAVIQSIRETKRKSIAVIGTRATIRSRMYEKVIHRINPDIEVNQVACPLLVPLIENERYKKGDIVIETVLADYLSSFADCHSDVLILSCTHYPVLQELIGDSLKGVSIINSGKEVSKQVKQKLIELNLLNCHNSQGFLHLYVSDKTDEFQRMSKVFLGEKLGEEWKEKIQKI